MKASKIYVRFSFSDVVLPYEEAMNPENEICGCEPFVVGYEDENGKECHSDGTYLDQPDLNQIDMFND